MGVRGVFPRLGLLSNGSSAPEEPPNGPPAAPGLGPPHSVPHAVTPVRYSENDRPGTFPGIPSICAEKMNEIKIAVLGSEGVGKSALIVRFFTRRFIGEYSSSSECIYRKRMAVDGRQMNLELCEPCSQACEGKIMLNDQINWADGFIVVYDIGNRSSFLTARAIMHLIRGRDHLGAAKSRDTECPIFLVGNKQDLCHMREVQREDAQCLAAEFHCQFYELSAAEHYQEVALIFSKMVQNASLSSKTKERRRRPSGSKSMAKLINNVFGKRRKSV